MSPVSKHMKRCVGREHTVYITVGHRLEKELDKESSFILLAVFGGMESDPRSIKRMPA